MKNDKIIAHVELTVNPEFLVEVLPMASQTREIILLEEGCESFILTRRVEEPNTLVLFAVYRSKQAYEWHLEQAYLKTLFLFMKGKLMGEPTTYHLEKF